MFGNMSGDLFVSEMMNLKNKVITFWKRKINQNVSFWHWKFSNPGTSMWKVYDIVEIVEILWERITEKCSKQAKTAL